MSYDMSQKNMLYKKLEKVFISTFKDKQINFEWLAI